MSNVLNEASLVLIPSGYKAGKVYSQIPENGNGDLSFTRSNDTATRVNSAGLIEKVRTNLLLQSNSFSTTWVNTRSTDTSGQSGYDGTSNAWLLESTASPANEAYIRQTISASGSNTFSIYAKAGTSNFIGFYIDATSGTDPFAFFNLSTGAVGSTSATATASIVSVGSGWYRCSVAFNTTIQTCDVYVVDADGSFNSTSGANVVIQDAQLETGDIATPYIPTTTAAVSVGMTANVPRLDYSGGGCPKLLLEPQRTNLVTYSEQMNNAAWNKINVSVSANQAAAPDGTTSADLVYPTTTGTEWLIEQVISATIGQTWTSSFFVKASGFSWVLVYSPNLGACWFNASTGVFGTIAGNVTATVLGQVNGYWRISFSGTVASSNAYFYAGPADANGSTTATANGTNGILIWGCQLEQGAYATSYIPTLGAAVTRGADACSKTGISSLLGGVEGTWFLELDYKPISSSTNPTMFVNSLSSTIGIASSGANTLRVRINAVNDIIATVNPTNRHKIAISFNASGVVCYVNGSSIALPNGASQVVSNLETVNLETGTRLNDINVYQMLYFQTRLTNTQLQELTTL